MILNIRIQKKIFKFYQKNLFLILSLFNLFIPFMGIGDWGLGIGDWGLGIWGLGPTPKPPTHNPKPPPPKNKF